ncbi:hypothetical protein LDENG_00053100, partial [Lucifuga dentata]
LLFVFKSLKSLNGLAPPYFSDLLCPHTLSRSLRTADQMFLVILRSKFKLKGDCAFAVAAPKLWNSLPLHIRTMPSLISFKLWLKS